MSGKIAGQVWDLELTTPKLIVLLAMADHADHEGNNVYPSTDLVAWKTNYSRRQVQRIIDDLIADKLLIVVKAPKGKVVQYRINLKAGKPKPPRIVEDSEPQDGEDISSGENGQNVTPPVTQLCHPTRDIQMSPEPSFNPSVNYEAATADPRRFEHEEPGESNAAPKAPKKRRERKVTDAEWERRKKLFEVVCQGSFGKKYQDINGSLGRATKITQQIALRSPDLTPDQLIAGYKHYKELNPDLLAKGTRITSVDTILDYVEKAADSKTIVKAANPNCEKCGGAGYVVVTLGKYKQDVQPCSCVTGGQHG